MGRIETSRWKPFKIIDLFKVKNTHSILKKKLRKIVGKLPMSLQVMKIMAFDISYNKELKEHGNCIMIGGKTLAITYQKENFYSNDSHNLVLYLKDNNQRTENVQLFLITALKASIGHTYNWGDSISFKSIQKDIIMLPVDKNGSPDFIYIWKNIWKTVKLQSMLCWLNCSQRNSPPFVKKFIQKIGNPFICMIFLKLILVQNWISQRWILLHLK